LLPKASKLGLLEFLTEENNKGGTTVDKGERLTMYREPETKKSISLREDSNC